MTTAPYGSLETLIDAVDAPDQRVAELAREHHARLTKPLGALGRLEDVAVQLCAISGLVPPQPLRPAIVVFAADHGVVEEGVTPWPQEVTAQMVVNICAGGAAINVLARAADASVTVVNVGVAHDLEDHPRLVQLRVRKGTANIRLEPAMTCDEAELALLHGARMAKRMVDDGANILVGGEMGIGNTTSAAALISALCEVLPSKVTGRGTGIDDAMWTHKLHVVEDACSRSCYPDDPIELLAELGGLEIAALAGFMLGGAAASVPVVVDGVIAVAAALVAAELCPRVVPFLIAGHRSSEPGATIALERLGIEPMLSLGMRLGEGSGAAAALPLIEAAGSVMREMATFESAGIGADLEPAGALR